MLRPVTSTRRFLRDLPGRTLPDSMTGSGVLVRDIPVETETPANIDEALKPARGVILGLLFSIPAWSAIGLLVWFLLSR
jgi:hypothetical protein